jgi:hypothetical protein
VCSGAEIIVRGHWCRAYPFGAFVRTNGEDVSEVDAPG